MQRVVVIPYPRIRNTRFALYEHQVIVAAIQVSSTDTHQLLRNGYGVIYGYIPSNTTITVFQLVFISSYMFRSVYNGHLQALARLGVLHVVYIAMVAI
jgi:hypothetical protein